VNSVVSELNGDNRLTDGPWRAAFAALAGLFVGLSLVKFGNPAILDHLVAPPAGALEILFQSWPLGWSYLPLAGLLVIGLVSARWAIPRPRWLALLPLAWLAWQWVAATQTVDAKLTRVTLVHFHAVLAGFYLGLFALAPAKRPGLFWAGVALGFAIMLWTGVEQRFGGLEATRQYVYAQPGWENLPPENLKRLGSNRIFATLLYPNTLAGVLLLLLPPLLVAIWEMATWLTPAARGAVAGLYGMCGLGCLYWSGSKAGWLIALAMLAVILLRIPLGKRWRVTLAVGLATLGLLGFFVRFSGYFQRGATSVSARGDYWRAAWRTFLDNPILGTGPGTFAVSYRQIKPPEAEMARLAHNDYLEQASDSGLIGFATYTTFLATLMVVLYRRCAANRLRFAVWLGLFGWAVQSGVEFGLYIPALGGVAFWLLGWLWGVCDAAPNCPNRRIHPPPLR
jgi:hypothetical protein